MEQAPPLKLSLKWIVFENLAVPGTFVIVDPNFEPRIGAPGMKPTPTLYMDASEHALEVAIDHMLHLYRNATRVKSRYTSLSDQVEEAFSRRHGWRKSEDRAA